MQLSRREFLARAAAASLAVGGLGPLLAACDIGADASGLNPLPRMPDPHQPLTWPIYADNRPIKSGLIAERYTTLRIYGLAERVSQQCLHDFGKKYGCIVELSTFATTAQAMQTLASGRAEFDVLLGVSTNVIPSLVPGQLIQPLNHTYIPNIRQAWPRFANPFYDLGARYTVPYTVYTTGFGWRKDLIDANPYTSSAGWAFPWQAALKGQVAILDDYRESIGLGLLVSGDTNLNETDPRLLDLAKQELRRLGGLVGLRTSNDATGNLASGLVGLHHARSGQVAAAASRLPAGTPASVLGYWFPPDGAGPVGNDINAVPRGARNPVLAHLFLNFMLDPQTALTNIHRNGFMQPLTQLTPARLVHQGALPPSLISTALLPTYFDAGLKEVPLPGPVEQLWLNDWKAVIGHG